MGTSEDKHGSLTSGMIGLKLICVSRWTF